MALLSDADRQAIYAQIMRDLSAAREPCAALKADLLAVVNATDSYQDANAAGFNAALPQPGRSALTTKQKSQIFHAVARRRYEKS